ncbi:uncharacterized protein LOC125673288 isoform X3 [Ostrea edulis]|uniref:uncharacterized protein LOC125673288 isoform X3 n=1 Tax=Ostrea edulis TaxID=37623 RepID=UPI0024AFB43E|nr:uncharacterized protein LOC125673288 isoform X3 [Ostrea edulis]
MDDVNIICATNDSLCREILKNFLTSIQKDYLLKNIQKKNDKETVLSKSSIFVFLNCPEINEDINAALNDVNPKEYFIMMIIVSHGRRCEKSCNPSFTVSSKVRMWCSIWGAEDNTCPNTEENMNANIMLDCFLKIINSQCAKMMDINGKEGIPCTQKVFQSFSKFMETKIDVSTTRSSRNSKGMPLVALCVQHDDTKKEIQKLHSLTGSPATLIMINACEVGVTLTPIKPSVDKTIFPNVVHLRYSDTSETIYDCPENRRTEVMLKKEFQKYRKSFESSWMGSIPSKFQVEESEESLKTPQIETQPPRTVGNLGAQMKSSEHSIPPTSKDFVILCNRRVDVCKNILMNFKTLYSFQNEFQWVTKARDAKNVKKRVLVCLKISRLTDDIADAIRMVDLSDAETFFLVIIHTVEQGIEVDTSFSSQDSRIVDVADIPYSERCGCYDCPESKLAISKFQSWFKS